ncbi:MAG: hypothetical protein HYX63_22745 [Gammaproteobacteria bacterium]|nr:hypothetical protein [Gammaproteobacteria bacterium]
MTGAEFLFSAPIHLAWLNGPERRNPEAFEHPTTVIPADAGIQGPSSTTTVIP